MACQRMTEEEVDGLEQTQEEFKEAVAWGVCHEDRGDRSDVSRCHL